MHLHGAPWRGPFKAGWGGQSQFVTSLLWPMPEGVRQASIHVFLFVVSDHADENVECHSIGASEEAVGDASHVICSNASHASHGQARIAIHSQVASKGTGVVNVHNAGGDVLIICIYNFFLAIATLVTHPRSRRPPSLVFFSSSMMFRSDAEECMCRPMPSTNTASVSSMLTTQA
jgi:hypothetical protein